MRLILEKQEIIEILEKHFEEKFDAGQVVIRTDPFEIELMKLAMPSEKNNVPPEPKRITPPTPEDTGPRLVNGFIVTPPSIAVDDPTLLEQRSGEGEAEPPPPGTDGFGVDNPITGEGSPAALVQRSRELAAEIDRKNPTLAEQNKRIRRGNAKEPSDDYSKEIG